MIGLTEMATWIIQNNSEDDSLADNESNIAQNNGIEDSECPEQ
jgi:hypothetical protein